MLKPAYRANGLGWWTYVGNRPATLAPPIFVAASLRLGMVELPGPVYVQGIRFGIGAHIDANVRFLDALPVRRPQAPSAFAGPMNSDAQGRPVALKYGLGELLRKVFLRVIAAELAPGGLLWRAHRFAVVGPQPAPDEATPFDTDESGAIRQNPAFRQPEMHGDEAP
jgi:hypothetical protein